MDYKNQSMAELQNIIPLFYKIGFYVISQCIFSHFTLEYSETSGTHLHPLLWLFFQVHYTFKPVATTPKTLVYLFCFYAQLAFKRTNIELHEYLQKSNIFQNCQYLNKRKPF